MAKRDSLTAPLSSPSSPDSFVNMKDSTTDKRSPVTALTITTLKNNINWLRDLAWEFKVGNDAFLTEYLTLVSAVAANTLFRTTQTPRLASLNMHINTSALGSGYASIEAAHEANVGKMLICKAVSDGMGGFVYTAYEVTTVA